MPKIGLHLSHELFPPSALLKFVRQAEAVGFQTAFCSDHFHPWGERYGQSAFAWSWLGAALEATSLPLGVVCAPGQRYHPAIIAQAAATLAEMYPGRFWLAVGSGEALNEAITGDAWPDKARRNARLKECVDVMRALWRGETVTHRGRVIVDHAKLYTLPERPPPLFGAALTAETARWLGGWADGLITAGSDHRQLEQIIAAFREGGGEGKPLILQTAISFADSDEQAVAEAHDRWRQAGLNPSQLADLRTPHEFDLASASVTPAEINQRLRCSSDLKQHIAWLEHDFELGFDEVYLHFVSANIDRCLQTFGNEVLPALTAEYTQ